MNRRELDRFFSVLARSWPHPTGIILIGGAAALLEGGSRPTDDVDFEVSFGGRLSVEDPDAFAGAVRAAERASGLAGQFTEDISRWGPVVLPPYRESVRVWKTFGPITVRLLDPADFALTKLRRGTTWDFQDLLLVVRAHRVPWRRLSVRCAAAVRASPASTHLRAFVKRVEYLFLERGGSVWGKGFDGREAVRHFRAAARLRG